MSVKSLDGDSVLRDEENLRWAFLEEESEPCVVVSQRMELIYINRMARSLVPSAWFGRRCFEVLPVVDEMCAIHCPTIKAVAESPQVVYCEELVRREGGSEVRLGVAAIPLPEISGDPAKAVLLLRQKAEGADQGQFERELVEDGARMLMRMAPQLV